jgi:hypothetical protein
VRRTSPGSRTKLGKGLKLFSEIASEVAALKLLQPAPLCLDRCETFSFQESARDQGGSLKRLHRPNRFRGGCLSLKGGEGIDVMAGVDPGYPNAGLRKPRRGFTLVAGKKKLQVGKGARVLAKS